MGNLVATRRPIDSQALQRLHIAAFGGNLRVVRQLVEKGVDVNGILGHEGAQKFGTPLAQAVRGRHIDIVAYLMANGASLSFNNGIDSHMLHYAAKCGFVEAVDYFIRWRDVNPGLVSTWNQSALHLACRFGHLNVVEYLVANHGGINARAKTEYQTPLLMAAHFGPAAVVKFLLDSGADVGASTQDGLEALHCVAEWDMDRTYDKTEDDRVASLKMLLRCGANPLAEYQDGTLPLHMATTARIAKTLLERDYWKSRALKDFDPTSTFTMLCKKNCSGETPLEMARRLCIPKPERPTTERNLRSRRVLVAFLEGWVSSRLFVPVSSDRVNFDLSEVINPRLNLFQRMLAESLFNFLRETTLGEVSVIIMGHLSPCDVANRWDMWLNS
jgi:hypothetical protein